MIVDQTGHFPIRATFRTLHLWWEENPILPLDLSICRKYSHPDSEHSRARSLFSARKMIQLESIRHAYHGRAILEDFSFALESGEHVLLTGPSGAGKSTLLRLVAGLENPLSGVVRLAGRDVSRDGSILVPPSSRNLGMVFQDLGLWPNLNALENVLLGIPRKSGSRKERKEVARSTLETCEAGSLDRSLPGHLSAGEQQRVALARALASSPRILLLDEPFSALDLSLREGFFQLLKKRIDAEDLTVITVSHDPVDAIGLEVDRVAVLESGRACESITLDRMVRGEGRSETLVCWMKRLSSVGLEQK